MSAEAAALVRSFPVGSRIVTLTVPKPKRGQAVCMTVEWSPDVPRRLSDDELHQYREGRNEAAADLADILGGTVGVVEL